MNRQAQQCDRLAQYQLIQRFKYPVMRIENGTVTKERVIDRPPVSPSLNNATTSQ